jgi:AbrB family looped-hinge helix DNA binding protein
MASSILSEKGWIVIPNEIRKKYGLMKGKRVNIIDYGGVISIIPLAKDAISESEGIFKGGPSLTKTLITERKKDKKLGK